MTSERMTHRLASAAGVARTPEADPWHDVVPGTLELAHGRIEFVHPRSPMDLLLAQDFEDDEQAYPPYWAEVWSSGVGLARSLGGADLTGRTVLEIGCGLGLPSIAAALAGGRVLATDRSADAIRFTEWNADLSGVALETAVRPWTDDHALVAWGPWDLVLAADVLYNDGNVAELLALLPRLLGDGGELRVADPGRPQAAGFTDGARRAGYAVTVTRAPGGGPAPGADGTASGTSGTASGTSGTASGAGDTAESGSPDPASEVGGVVTITRVAAPGRAEPRR